MAKTDTTQVQLLVGTIKGVFIYSADPARKEWELRGPFLHGWEVYSLTGDQRRSPRLIAGTSHLAYGPAIRISDDLGETWRQVEKGPEYPADSDFKLTRIWQIAPGRADHPDTFYAGVDEAGLFVSHDRGESWEEVRGLTSHPTRPDWFPGGGGLCLHTIVQHPTNPQRMWVGISAAGVFRTDDGGATWQPRNKGLMEANLQEPVTQEIGSCVHKMVLDPSNPDTLFMQEHCGVFRSDDGGDSWYTIEEGLPKAHLHHPEFWPFGFPLAITPAGDMFIMPLESSEQRTSPQGELSIYRRGRNDDAWQPCGPIEPAEPRYTSVLRDAMTIDDQPETGLYFGTTSGDVFSTLDNGDTWQKLPGQLPRVLSLKTWTLEA